MIEYFMFIIVYQNENLNNDGYKITNYNTLNEKRNNYENIWIGLKLIRESRS